MKRGRAHARGCWTSLAAFTLAQPALAAAALAETLAAEVSSDSRAMLVAGVVLGVVAFAVVSSILALSARRRARRAEARARSSAGELDRRIELMQTVLLAEPQILVHWDAGLEPAVIADTLDPGLGVPSDISELLRYASWLDRESARQLDERLEKLRHNGEPFNLMLKTAAGGHIEADGRAAGGGSVLKIRDLAGRRRELAELLQQHQRLAHDIDAMRALADTLPSPVWLRDGDGRIDWVNGAYARAVKASGAREVVRQQIELLDMHMRAAAARSLAAGNVFSRRAEVTMAGAARAMEATVLPVGRGSAGIVMEPKTAEAASGQPAEDGLHTHATLLDRMATAIAVFAPDHALKFWNRSFQALWQLDARWLEGHPTHAEILDRLRQQRKLEEHSDYRSWKQRQLDIYASGKTLDERWHLPDGRAVHVVAERGGDGSVTWLIENLTERLALESRFNAMLRVQKETLDNLREGVAVFATDGRLRLYNPAFSAMWKLDGAMLTGEPHVDDVIALCRPLMMPDDDTWDRLKTAITSIHERRQPLEGEIERADGSIYVYAGLPLPDGGMLVTCVDMTDSKRVQKALMDRNEALEAANRLKSAFISHVNYELRTPLTNIIGFAEMLAGPHVGKLNDKQREYLSDILSSSHTLRAIIDDILDLTTIDAGAMELDIEPVSASDVVRAAVEGVKERLRRTGLKLRVEIGKDVGTFPADRRRVIQVLYNLLSNAIGFSDKGGMILVTCRRVGNGIVMTVEDKGRGIARDQIDAVFERFESRPGGSSHRGAGLGLAIVKSLVELHGGEVSLTSAENVGTTVTVIFPSGMGLLDEEEQGSRRQAAARA